MTIPSITVPKNVWFTALIAVVILCAGLFLMRHIPSGRKDIAATAFLLDIIVTFPIIYYFMIIRPLKVRKWSIVLVFTLCCAAAYFILPAHQQSYIIQVRKITILFELGAVVYGLIKIRKVRAKYKLLKASIPDISYNL